MMCNSFFLGGKLHIVAVHRFQVFVVLSNSLEALALEKYVGVFLINRHGHYLSASVSTANDGYEFALFYCLVILIDRGKKLLI